MSMTPLSLRLMAQRAILSRTARYQRAATHGEGRSDTTRVLHVLLLLTVVSQLLSSQLIRLPFPGSPPSTLYLLHEYLGIGSLGLVTLFWFWALIRHGETKFGRLFPWFSPQRVVDVLVDGWSHLEAMLTVARGGTPHEESSGAMASAVHGLGLLVLSAMAATGTVFFFMHGTAIAHEALYLHRAIGTLMWSYLIGHAGIAALHHLVGSDIVLRMFWIRRGITVTTPPPRAARRGTVRVRETVGDR